MAARRLVCAAVAGALPALAAMADEPTALALAQTLPMVAVSGVKSLPGVEQPREQIAAAVQSARAEDIERSQALDLSDFLQRRMGSVQVSEMQGNPFQPDLAYRGYTASPLLGTPQGLSVYLDGVRLNQPFGDVLSWDLIPRSAIASLVLMPGSSPLFGLNTLGGALSLQTKSGESHPGSAVQALAGSAGRRSVEFEHGGSDERGLHWFSTGTSFNEAGWREASASRLRQLFGKLGYGDARNDVFVEMSLADNRLAGNGLQEMRLLARDWASVYTRPDETHNRSWLVNVGGQRELASGAVLAGNVYQRRIHTTSRNGDLNTDALTEPVCPQADGDACNGVLTQGQSTQSSQGASVRWSLRGKVHAPTIGAAIDASRASFAQSAQPGTINGDRSVTPAGAAAAGLPTDGAVDLDARTRTWSLFASDTITLARAWHLTLSGRTNRTTVRNRDRLHPGGTAGSLDGDDRFARFNPALGLSFAPTHDFTAYAGYNEGSRTPSAIELGCADPAQPCRLPNAMAGDPPLRQVVSKTWEAGVRGSSGAVVSWNAGVFSARNVDDILFVASEQNGFGNFRNVGQTRRRGIELGLSAQAERIEFDASYAWVEATFRSAETLGGASNSSNQAGTIGIQPGDRMPLVPRHLLKANIELKLDARWTVSLGMAAAGRAYARGNENNRHEPDGVHYLGPGASAGHAVFDLGGRFQAGSHASWFWQVSNLFDRRYASAAQLGPTGFDANGRYAPAAPGEAALQHSTFFAPGAPRLWRAGLRVTFP